MVSEELSFACMIWTVAENGAVKKPNLGYTTERPLIHCPIKTRIGTHNYDKL